MLIFVDFAKSAKSDVLKNLENACFYKFVKRKVWSKVAKRTKNTIS